MQNRTLRQILSFVGIGVMSALVISCGRAPGTGVSTARRAPDPLNATVQCGEPTRYNESANAGSFDTANILHSCSIVSGTIGGNTRHDDYFRVDLPSGKDGTLRLTVVESRTDWAPTLELFDASKKKIATGKFNEPGTSRFIWENEVKAGETYYYVLKDNVANKTPYRLLTEFFPN